MEIEPRGTIYRNDGSFWQWTRVINGWVYHFSRTEASEYWQTPVTFRVRRHPYGRLIDGTETVHKKLTFS